VIGSLHFPMLRVLILSGWHGWRWGNSPGKTQSIAEG
jgi:hypothetical protein